MVRFSPAPLSRARRPHICISRAVHLGAAIIIIFYINTKPAAGAHMFSLEKGWLVLHSVADVSGVVHVVYGSAAQKKYSIYSAINKTRGELGAALNFQTHGRVDFVFHVIDKVHQLGQFFLYTPVTDIGLHEITYTLGRYYECRPDDAESVGI